MSNDVRRDARALKPVLIQEYLRSHGWAIATGTADHSRVVVYRRDGNEVEIPLRTELIDYPRRVVEALELVADVEGTDVPALVQELTQPVGDTLAVRLASESVASGTVPLVDAIRLRDATRNLLLAAAHSTVSPLAYFPRLSRADAVALLQTVREGQSQRGSYVARFIVPVDPAVGGQAELAEPFGRRVVCTLMRALDEVRQVRSLGAYDDLLSREQQGVSGNLLGALASLDQTVGAGLLEFSVSWSYNRAQPTGGVTSVAFPEGALRGLHAVAEAMRGRAQTKGFEVVGYVTHLTREVSDGDAEGDVVIVPTGDVRELSRLHVHLDASSYREAINAHEKGRMVRVVGTLHKTGRRWALAEPSGFEMLPMSADDSPTLSGIE